MFGVVKQINLVKIFGTIYHTNYNILKKSLHLLTNSSNMNTGSSKYVSVDFEVYGRVQGVFFRKYTQKQAQKLGLSGWCMNTESGTVQGNMQGMESKVNEMKSWLQSVGSPQSRIDKAVFTAESSMKQKPTPGFSIRR